MAEVLVVEPGELGELLATLLGQYGMSAVRARSGEEALERALERRPSVVVVEYDLPDASGADVGELLRSELGCRVVLTYAQGLIAEADEELLRRIGAMDASFARPFRSLTLVETAARLLGRELQRGDDVAAAIPLSSTEGAPVTAAPFEGAAGSSLGAGIEDATSELSFEPALVSSAGAALVTGEGPPVEADGPAPPLKEKAPFSPGALGDLWQRVKDRRGAPVERKAPTDEGALSPRALADMLDAFHQSQTTGELWLQNGRARRVLLLRRGSIVGARSNIETEELSTLGLRRGALTPETADLVRKDVLGGARKTIVEALIARGLLPERALRGLVEEHVRRIALGAFTWQSGSMKVTLEGRAAREAVPVHVPVGDIIVRSILLTEGDEALRAAAPDDARFSPAADGGYGLEDLTLSADEARVVVAMDGTKTVTDLITLFAPVPAERTIRGLAAGLLCLHLVRFVGWGHAEARRITFF
jgi:CheY-like chemotaxis protein